MNKRLEIRKAIENGNIDLHVDRTISKKNGTLELRRGFFYRMGMDADQWATKVVTVINAAGYNVTLEEAEEHWNAWPKDSYFSAIIRIGGDL